MSYDPSAPGMPGQQEQAPAKSGSRFWLFLGLGCGGLLLLCCGGGLIGTVLIGKNSMQMTQNDPAAVQQKASEIADFDLPDGFQPDTAISISVPFTGQTLMSMVSFTPPDKQGMVFLTAVGTIAAGADRDQVRHDVEQRMNQQGMGAKNLDVEESRDLELEIRGKPAKFRIQKARDPQTKQDYVQFDGVFEGKQGAAVLIGQVKADDFTEDDAEQLLRSIK